ncbi:MULTISPECIES: hypothetical protein [unclassified Pseudoalteromonas]|uniref:hypothetical protein n=1 Tax=unclassified Pseudoalteromonas TaxID=194690 RepID=UPI00140D1BE9|nr:MULTISPECIES: hypothetical protein [unclassified Pseudoalteromonas]MBH0026800.1 hypothetical protein [Pseudoalteromonas sp. SWN29]
MAIPELLLVLFVEYKGTKAFHYLLADFFTVVVFIYDKRLRYTFDLNVYFTGIGIDLYAF